MSAACELRLAAAAVVLAWVLATTAVAHRGIKFTRDHEKPFSGGALILPGDNSLL